MFEHWKYTLYCLISLIYVPLQDESKSTTSKSTTLMAWHGYSWQPRSRPPQPLWPSSMSALYVAFSFFPNGKKQPEMLWVMLWLFLISTLFGANTPMADIIRWVMSRKLSSTPMNLLATCPELVDQLSPEKHAWAHNLQWVIRWWFGLFGCLGESP